MKNEKLTDQICALYFGCDATITWLVEGAYFEKGEQWVAPINLKNIDWLRLKNCEITPHLRRLDSLNEQEALELFKISRGEEWDYEYNSSLASKDRGMGKIWSCLENWWMGNYEMFAENGNWLVGDPNVWLYLLSKGFDLFGLIEAGLAKEETK